MCRADSPSQSQQPIETTGNDPTTSSEELGKRIWIRGFWYGVLVASLVWMALISWELAKFREEIISQRDRYLQQVIDLQVERAREPR